MSEQYQGIRYLGPGDVHFSRNALGQLRAVLADGTTHDDVLVYRTRPISDPSRFISIRVGVTQSEQREIGLIRNLAALAPEQSRLLKEELAKRYFIHIVTQIRSMREEFGYLYWDCDTDKGRREFPTARWDQSKVVHADENCHIITDVDGNRYEIRNLSQLDPDSRSRFLRYIYW